MSIASFSWSVTGFGWNWLWVKTYLNNYFNLPNTSGIVKWYMKCFRYWTAVMKSSKLTWHLVFLKTQSDDVDIGYLDEPSMCHSKRVFEITFPIFCKLVLSVESDWYHSLSFFCGRFSRCIGSLKTTFTQQLGLPQFKTEAVWKLQPFRFWLQRVMPTDCTERPGLRIA